jgi:hypothetical protein
MTSSPQSSNSSGNVFPLIAGPPPSYVPGAKTFSWWQQYEAGLSGHYGWPQRITAPALAELDRSSDEILASIPLLSNATQWQAISYRRTSVVVGGIQSGKTRSMIAVAAKALDRGFPVVVVLSGLKNDLREQTAKRFHTDLLQLGEAIHDSSGVICGYTHPRGMGPHGSRQDFFALPYSHDAHFVGSLAVTIRGALSKGEVVVLVVKKQREALRAVKRSLDAVWQNFRSQPPPLFVIDDECDEASVAGSPRARLPAMIHSLWANAWPTQPVVYVGYTATPQANIFQTATNPLYPQCVHTLRAPADSTTALTFAESGHPGDWYTGTELFFEWLQQQRLPNFLMRPTVTQPELDQTIPWTQSQLSEAIIAYFVSGAIRLEMTGKRLGAQPFDAPAHSMLVHTDVQRDEHWTLAEAVCEICRPSRLSAAAIRGTMPANRVDGSKMRQWLAADMPRWQAWHADFHRGFAHLQRLYSNQYRVVAFPSWATVSSLLHTHVFDNVKLKVVNSDNDADRLDYTRLVNSAGSPQQPEDVFTIIIGGNVLSRGLTIEGLAISYFTRWANMPLDDTTMQRQRWLGYRGSHFEFCRVFSSPGIMHGLRRASNADIAARQQMAYFAAAGIQNVKASYLLFQGAGKPTGKMGTARSGIEASFTGAKPFVRFVQPQTAAGGTCPLGVHNEQVAHRLATAVRASGAPRRTAAGAIAGYTQAGVTALDVADHLDSLEYANHNPSETSAGVQAFDSAERLYNLSKGTLHRRPNAARPVATGIPASFDPYMIAAYLRLWHYAYDAITYGNMPNRQLAANLSQWQVLPPPTFNIVYRCGSKAPSPGSLFVDPLTDKIVHPDGTVHAAWGRSGNLDEEWFDLGAAPAAGPATPRVVGTSGLLMLYVIHRGSLGAAQAHDLPTFGVAIPLGGPAFKFTAAV